MHLLKYTYNSGYLLVQTPKSPPRYIVFKDRKDAENCKAYVKKFTSEYGKWPNFELENDAIEKIVSASDGLELQGELEIEELSPDYVLDMLRVIHVGMLLCYKFKADKNKNKYVLDISAQEVDQDEHTPAYIEYIDQLYKNQQ
jgi:hypothetical protein